MMRKGFQALFIIVLIKLNIDRVFGDEFKEETQPYYEYIQIFKSIPTLFEYLLDALEERPEILEKNDVTVFKRNIDVDTDDPNSSDKDKKTEKRDANFDNLKIGNEHSTNNMGKRDTGHSKDVSKTTVAYEYGNSNIIMTGFHELDNNKYTSKRIADYNDRSAINKNKRERVTRKNSINSPNKRSVKSDDDDVINEVLRDYGNAFFGFESLFGLDLKPEDIEERILTAVKLLEEHNSKKNKQD